MPVAADSAVANPDALFEQLWTALAGLVCTHDEGPCRVCYGLVRRQVKVVGGALIVAAYGKLSRRERYDLAGRGVLHLLRAAHQEADE